MSVDTGMEDGNMALKRITYAEARPKMKPGDVIAFSGKGHFSEIIKMATFSEVSHVGVILKTKVADHAGERYFNQIIESTSLHGFNGVQVSRFSDRLSDYNGEIWWLPLRVDLRKDAKKHDDFYEFLFNQAKAEKPYDMPQAVKSALDLGDDLPFGLQGPGYNKEDFSRFFCSELVAAGLERAKVVKTVNASEVTPIDLCRWKIYEDDYYVLKGDVQKEISRFNRLNPRDWDV